MTDYYKLPGTTPRMSNNFCSICGVNIHPLNVVRHDKYHADIGEIFQGLLDRISLPFPLNQLFGDRYGTFTTNLPLGGVEDVPGS